MKLVKNIQQGQLSYYTQNDDSISVSENQHYRWLAFDNVVQSMMLKRKPSQLTFPHQISLLSPLLFFRPKKVVEFGLGGGNLARFLLHYLPDLTLHTIEYSQEVIECFERFFNPQAIKVNLHHCSALDWLHLHKKMKPDWFICDIYHKDQSINDSLILTKNILKKVDEQAVLSLNLPSPSNEEINYFLAELKVLAPTKQLVYFHIPHYLNVIIHLLPYDMLSHAEESLLANTVLPARTFKRWRKYWRHGMQ
jgi:spermidine synthase